MQTTSSEIKILFYTIILVTIYFVFRHMITYLNNTLLFRPIELTQKEYELTIQRLEHNYKPFEIKIDDMKIYGGLYCLHKQPEFTDDLILYSHGNSGNISRLLETDSINDLAKTHTVVVYDYRGYGLSKGTPSEIDMYEDIKTVYDYLIDHGSITEKIIVYGHSLGGAISANLVRNLTDNHVYPKMLIMQSTFSTLHDIATDLIGLLSNLAIYEFNNIECIKKIDQKIPVHVFHSKSDKIIPYRHGLRLKNTRRCFFYEIKGDHNNPIFENVRNKILKVT